MLFFRSEERVREWCAAHGYPMRPLVTMDQLWTLATTWYSTRLQEHSRRPQPDEMRSIETRSLPALTHCSRPFETRPFPQLARCFPRSFTFYVAFPIRSIRRVGFPHLCRARRPRLHSLTASFTALPSISEIPFLDSGFQINCSGFAGLTIPGQKC